MSAGTTAVLKPIVAHVPVDRFDIVDGLRTANWLEIMERLSHRKTYAHMVFTLKTAASTQEFKRRLSLASIFAVEGDTFNFTAIFCGRVVSGVYNMRTRTGWFNLD